MTTGSHQPASPPPQRASQFAATTAAALREGQLARLATPVMAPESDYTADVDAILARHPNIVYLVLGATHPHLIAREGEAYRRRLEKLSEERGVKDHVIFHNRFVSRGELSRRRCGKAELR